MRTSYDFDIPSQSGLAYTSRKALYGHVKSNHFSPPTVCGGEPIFKNPGRKEDIPVILDHIKKIGNVNEDGRRWTIAGCDGSPAYYILAHDVINNTFICLCTTCEDDTEVYS